MERIKDLSEIITDRPDGKRLAKALAKNWQYWHEDEVEDGVDIYERRQLLSKQAMNYGLTIYSLPK